MKIIGDSYNRYVLLNFLVFMLPVVCAMLLAVDYRAGAFDRRQIVLDMLVFLNLLLAFLLQLLLAYYGVALLLTVSDPWLCGSCRMTTAWNFQAMMIPRSTSKPAF
jgi:hypothetical protein